MMLLTFPVMDEDFKYLQRTIDFSGEMLVYWLDTKYPNLDTLDCGPANERFILPLSRRLNEDEIQRCVEWLEPIGGRLVQSCAYGVQIAIFTEEKHKILFKIWWG